VVVEITIEEDAVVAVAVVVVVVVPLTNHLQQPFLRKKTIRLVKSM
jgi:hypothetical protein